MKKGEVWVFCRDKKSKERSIRGEGPVRLNCSNEDKVKEELSASDGHIFLPGKYNPFSSVSAYQMVFVHCDKTTYMHQHDSCMYKKK